MSMLEDCYGSTAQALLGKFKQTMVGTPPPMFRTKRVFGVPKLADEAGFVRLSARRRSDSGILELKLPGIRLDDKDSNWRVLVQTIREIAAIEDDRPLDDIQQMFQPHSHAVQLRTFVELPDGQRIAAIGPGGNVAAQEVADGLQIDVVIRRRGEVVMSAWRNPEMVIQELFGAFGINADEIELKSVSVEFGYLELSKYEHQSLLRPSVIAILDLPGDESGVHYRYVAAASTTTAPGVTNDEGLGDWCD